MSLHCMFSFSNPQFLSQIHWLKVVNEVMRGLNTPLAKQNLTVNFVTWHFCNHISHRLVQKYKYFLLYIHHLLLILGVGFNALLQISVFLIPVFSFYSPHIFSNVSQWDTTIFEQETFLGVLICINGVSFVTNNTKPNQTLWNKFNHSHRMHAFCLDKHGRYIHKTFSLGNAIQTKGIKGQNVRFSFKINYLGIYS